MKTPKVDIESKLREQGYISAREVSERTGKDISTIYRWMDEGEVDSETVMGRRYVLVRSLIIKVGVKASELLGFTTDEQSAELK